MHVTCRDLLKLPSMRSLRLVAGEKGLDHIVTWPYFAEGYELRPWLNGGELIIYSTLEENRKGNSLEKLIRVCREADAACILIYVNEQFTEIPEELITLGNKLEIPLFEVPWEVKVVQLTREISNYIFKCNNQDDFMGELLKNILLGKEENVWSGGLENLITLRENKGYVMAVMMIYAQDYYELPKIFNYYRSCLQYALSGLFRNVCSCILKNLLVFLIPQEDVDVYKLGDRLQNILNGIEDRNQKLELFTGISRGHENYKEIPLAFKEALYAVQYVESRKEEKVFQYYEDFGIEKILFEMPDTREMERLFRAYIGILVENDLEYDGKLCDTLLAFLENNCDLNITSEKLFIHKNSLRYRLKKIENLTKRKFSKMEDVSEFYIAWKIGKYLKKL